MIELRNLTFGFKSRPVFCSLTLQIEAGGTTVFLGPSGSGKTTLVRLVCGLLKPTSGSVTLGGASRAEPGRVRGVLFQDDTLVPWLTVLENAIFPLSASANTKSVAETVKWLADVGLDGALGQLPHELSGGMKKRLEFVRATNKDDRYLIADEPFSGLDFHQRRVLWGFWRQAMENKSRTGVLVTQNVEEALALGDRFIVISGERPVRVVLDVQAVDLASDVERHKAIVEALVASASEAVEMAEVVR